MIIKYGALAFATMLLLAESVTAQDVKAVVSAGDFKSGIAPLGIASVFGSSLSTVTAAATTLPLPTAIFGSGLAWCDLTTDPGMLDCLALRLFFVSPSQINVAIPSVGSNSLAHSFAVRPTLNGAWSGAAFGFTIQNLRPAFSGLVTTA
jgi:uncharacterized protein (TIGR03437 family)